MANYVSLVNEYRGDLLDVIHLGYACIVDSDSRTIARAGDENQLVSYRSASKPIQALPTLARGLDKKYGLTDEESAIFAGSHKGEECHVHALESIMRKADLSEDMLIMLPAAPQDQRANENRIRLGLPPRKLYHNCSGKHLSLMLLQRELGGDVRDYWKIDSLAQREVKRAIALVSEFPEDSINVAVDGCGVPVYAVPVRNVAIAFKNMARPENIREDALAAAAKALSARINRYPYMISGTATDGSAICSQLNSDPDIICKGGALGVYGLGIKSLGVGISFKLIDGSYSRRPHILRSAFERIGYGSPETRALLQKLAENYVLNDNGVNVGRIETTVEWR